MSFYDTYASNVARISQGAADARAQAELQRGNIWANAFGQLGQLAAAIPGQLEAQKDRETERQRQATADSQRDAIFQLNYDRLMEDRQEDQWMKDALASSFVDGQLDEQRLAGNLQLQGATHLLPRMLQTYRESEKAKLDLENAQRQGIVSAAQVQQMRVQSLQPYAKALLEVTDDPESFAPVFKGALQAVALQHGQPFAQELDALVKSAGPEGLKMFLTQLATNPQNLMKLGPDETLVDVSNLGPDGRPRVVVQGTPEERVLTLDQQLGQAQQRMAAATTPAERDAARNEINNIIRTMGQAASSTRAPEKPEGITPNEAISATMRLRREWTTETAAARKADLELKQMQSSLQAVKDGAAAPGSQGVLVTFQKILDPMSVVRESEYARSASGLALLAQLQGQWERIVSGGAGVPVQELEKFVSLASAFANNQQLSTEKAKASIQSIIKDYGLNETSIFGGGGEALRYDENGNPIK